MGSKEKTTVPFNGTPEQEKALREMIGQHKGQQGALSRLRKSTAICL